MTKADLAEVVHAHAGISKKEAADLVDHFFELIKDVLASGETIKLSKFGNLRVLRKRSRVGRNPQTGEAIEISARSVLSFKPSQVLKAALNPDADAEPGHMAWADATG